MSFLSRFANSIRLMVAPTPWCGLWLVFMVPLAALLAWGGRPEAMAVIGVVGMSLCFFAGLWMIRWVLSPSIGVCGVARTLVDEAIRMKVVLAVIIGLLLLVPFLSILLDPRELLKYRVQTFLTWTMSGSALLLSLMTLFLASGTICNELARHQIDLTLTKPIRRGHYLLGKWLGIVLLDLMLVSVVGIGVYAFSMMLQQQPHHDQADRHAVDKQILVARETAKAHPPTELALPSLMVKQLAKLRAERHVDGLDANSSSHIQRIAKQTVIAGWHTIPPRDSRSYLFKGLNRAKAFGDLIQLRFKPVVSMSAPDELVRLAIWLNGRPYPVNDHGQHLQVVVAESRYHVLDLPVKAADADGNLTIRIANVNLNDMGATFPAGVSFTPGEGLEILYQVDRFEPNLVRALVLIWIRLGFLAMLGLAVGSLLSFPIACLLGLLIYVTASANGFLLESMQAYVSFPTGDLSLWERLVWVPRTFFSQLFSGEFEGAVKILVRLLGNSFVLLIPSFSDYDPVWLLADGRQIGANLIVSAIIRIGVVWTGTCAFIAWLIFDRRELARVTV